MKFGILLKRYFATWLSPQPPNDAGLVQIVGRHFHFHAVADGVAQKAFTNPAGNGGQHEMLVVELDAAGGAGQDDFDGAFHRDGLFCHKNA